MDNRQLQEALEDIKGRIRISEIAARYTTLRRVGRDSVGLCPFHTENSPSFRVSDSRGRAHCFGCGFDGDVIYLVQSKEGTTFMETVRQLAAEAGVTLSEPSAAEEADSAHKKRLLALLKEAAIFYYLNLRDGDSEEVRLAHEYLQLRGILPDSIYTFGLGYAYQVGGSLRAALTYKGYTDQEMEEAGVLVKTNRQGRDQYHDFFRGRLIFPIKNRQGQVIAFGGRLVPGVGKTDNQPKYVNSKASVLFDKSNTLYGLPLAVEQIRRTKTAVVVEGYLDVIAAHQAGHTNVLAPLGTALTHQHFAILKSLATRVVLALDGDNAGQEATAKSIETARATVGIEQAQYTEVMVANLPTGKDPDEVIREDLGWERMVTQALPIMEFYFERAKAGYDLSNPLEKRKALNSLTPLLLEIRDRIQLAHYIKRLADLFEVEEELIRKELAGKVQQPGGRPPKPSLVGDKPYRVASTQEDRLLAEYLHYFDIVKGIREHIKAKDNRPLDSGDFAYSENRLIFETVNALFDDFEKLDMAKIKAELADEPAVLFHLEQLIAIGQKEPELKKFEQLTASMNFRLNLIRRQKLLDIKTDLQKQLDEMEPDDPECLALLDESLMIAERLQQYV